MSAAPGLYAQVLRDEFQQLAAPVRRFHELTGRHTLVGWVETSAPSSAPARLLARLLGTPLHGSRGPIRFELDAAADGETWTRHFPTRVMTSRFRLRGRQIEETLGPARLLFDLQARQGDLEIALSRMRFLGIACPRWLMPRVTARESGAADRLEFDVSASLPLVGLVARYRGHLSLPVEHDAA